MGRIVLDSGLTKDEVFSQFGEKIGEAVYDLGDVEVRGKLVGLHDKFKSIADEYEPKMETLESNKETDADGIFLNIEDRAALEIESYNKMVEVFDEAIGEGFCERALGTSKNPMMLWSLAAGICENYEVSSAEEMKKFMNRSQRRASAKKK